jgi:hypothetical protein
VRLVLTLFLVACGATPPESPEWRRVGPELRAVVRAPKDYERIATFVVADPSIDTLELWVPQVAMVGPERDEDHRRGLFDVLYPMLDEVGFQVGGFEDSGYSSGFYSVGWFLRDAEEVWGGFGPDVGRVAAVMRTHDVPFLWEISMGEYLYVPRRLAPEVRRLLASLEGVENGGLMPSEPD